jgi:hypothetical protein
MVCLIFYVYVMKRRVAYYAGNFVISRGPVSCSRRTLLHGVIIIIILIIIIIIIIIIIGIFISVLFLFYKFYDTTPWH